MDLCGRGYVIKHCISLYYKRKEELLYKIYTTDLLRALVNSMGAYKVESRFEDMLPGKRKPREKTAEEIIADVIEKAGLTLEVNG